MRMSPLCLFGVVSDLNLEAILVFGALFDRGSIRVN